MIFLVSVFSLAQNKYQAKKIVDYDVIINNLILNNDDEIYEITKPELDSLVKKSNKDFTYVYTFAWWCEPCVEKLPSVLNLKDSIDSFQLLIITCEKDNSKELYLTQKYKNSKFNIQFPIFNISDDFSSRRWEKYDQFIQEIIPGHKDYGLSLSIIIDNKENKVLYASTYKESKDEQISKINSLLQGSTE